MKKHIIQNITNSDSNHVNELILKELNRKPVPVEYIKSIKKYADDRKEQHIKSIRKFERQRKWNIIKSNFNFRKDGYFDILWNLIKFNIITFVKKLKYDTIMFGKKLYLFVSIPPKKKALFKGVEVEKLSDTYRRYLLKNNIDINDIKRISQTINTEEIKKEPYQSIPQMRQNTLSGNRRIQSSFFSKLIYPSFDLFKHKGNPRNLLPE